MKWPDWPQNSCRRCELDSNRTFVLSFNNINRRRWLNFYGIMLDLCGVIWRKLDVHNYKDRAHTIISHLMGALCFLKVYGREEDNSNYSGGLGGKRAYFRTSYFLSEISSVLGQWWLLWWAAVWEEDEENGVCRMW
jgi:hypothetical protein